MYKAYETVKKIQDEVAQSNMTNIQTAGKKNWSAIGTIIISAIIGTLREVQKNTYIVYADA